MPAKTRRIVSAQGGCHSRSLCDSKFTTHSKFTTTKYFLVRQGPLGGRSRDVPESRGA